MTDTTAESVSSGRTDGPDMAFMVQKLGEIGSNAGTLSVAHNERALRLLSTNRLVSLFITVLSFIVGSSLFSSVIHNGSSTPPISVQLTLVTFGFSLAATILSGYLSAYNPAQNSQEHKNASDLYSSLEAEINSWHAEYGQVDSCEEAFIKYEGILEKNVNIREQSPPISARLR